MFVLLTLMEVWESQKTIKLSPNPGRSKSVSSFMPSYMEESVLATCKESCIGKPSCYKICGLLLINALHHVSLLGIKQMQRNTHLSKYRLSEEAVKVGLKRSQIAPADVNKEEGISRRINFIVVHTGFCSKLFLILCLRHYWDKYKKTVTNKRPQTGGRNIIFWDWFSFHFSFSWTASI